MMMEPAQSIESMKGSHREWVGNGPRHPPAWATSGAGRPTGASGPPPPPPGGRMGASPAPRPGGCIPREGSAAGGHRSDGAPGAPARGVRAPTTGAAPRAPGAAQLGQASCDGDSCESCDNNTRLSDRRLPAIMPADPAMCDCDTAIFVRPFLALLREQRATARCTPWTTTRRRRRPRAGPSRDTGEKEELSGV